MMELSNLCLNVLLTIAFSTRRSPTLEGPLKWNMSMAFSVGWALHNRLQIKTNKQTIRNNRYARQFAHFIFQNHNGLMQLDIRIWSRYWLMQSTNYCSFSHRPYSQTRVAMTNTYINTTAFHRACFYNAVWHSLSLSPRNGQVNINSQWHVCILYQF